MISYFEKKTSVQSFPEYDDDIYPYATFQAWQPVGQVSSQRGFQTFVYQGSDSPGVNSYAPGEVSDKSMLDICTEDRCDACCQTA